MGRCLLARKVVQNSKGACGYRGADCEIRCVFMVANVGQSERTMGPFASEHDGYRRSLELKNGACPAH